MIKTVDIWKNLSRSGQNTPSSVGLHYYAGVVENSEKVFKNHKQAALCTFGTRSSVVKGGITKPGPSADSGSQNSIGNDSLSMHIDDKNGKESKSRKLDCQFGSYYYKKCQEQSGHTHLQGTRKVSYKAHISVRTITTYLEFQITEKEVSKLGARKLKERKREQLARLQNAFEK